MQQIDNRKETNNDLEAHYRPIGPRDLLAAALMLHARKDADDSQETERRKAAAAA